MIKQNKVVIFNVLKKFKKIVNFESVVMKQQFWRNYKHNNVHMVPIVNDLDSSIESRSN